MGLITALKGASSDFGPMRTLRNPQTGYTSTEVEITIETAMKISAIYASHRILAGQFAQLRLKLNKSEGKGKREAVDHSLWPLISVRPNKWQPIYRFKQHVFSHLFFNGNMFIFKEINGRGYNALVPLQPWKVQPKQAIRSGELFYEYRDDEYSQPEVIPSHYICHCTGHSFDGIMGNSLITYIANTAGIAIEQQKHTEHTLANKAIPAGTISVDGKLSDKAFENVKKSMDEMHSGAENSGKILVLENGAKFGPLSMTMEDLEFIADKRFTVEEISRFTGVPLTMLSDNTQSTFDNVQGLKEQFLEFTLSDYLTNITSTFNACLLTEKEQKTHFFEFDTDAYLRMDKEKMSVFIGNMRQWGILNRDECRGEIGYDPSEDGEGETFFRPENMAPADKPYQPTNPTKENQKTAEIQPKSAAEVPKIAAKKGKKGLKASFSRLFDDVFSRFDGLFSSTCERESKKLSGEPLLVKMGEEFRKREEVFTEAIKPTVLSLLDLTGEDTDSAVTLALAKEFSQDVYSELCRKWSSDISSGGKLSHDKAHPGRSVEALLTLLKGDIDE